MPDSGVIASVSETLKAVLSEAVNPLGATAEIYDLQGTISTEPARNSRSSCLKFRKIIAPATRRAYRECQDRKSR